MVNPVILSILLLCIMCFCKINVLLSLVTSAIVAGIISGMSLKDTMDIFVSGMGNNAETALSYILLGTFAAAMIRTGFADIFAKKTATFVKNKKYILIFVLTLAAILSQNLIPVHIAFIPVLIPPLLPLMNKLKLDRRAVACALTFGLKAPYIAIPAGFGLIFRGLIADNLKLNGITVSDGEITKYLAFLGIAMIVGFIIAVFISYSKERIYEEKSCLILDTESPKFERRHFVILIAAVLTLAVQLLTGSLPLGAMTGLGIIFGTGIISGRHTDELINQSVGLMGYIAFVMLTASGFAAVLQSCGGIDSFVNTVLPYLNGGKIIIAVFMLLAGLIITTGTGTSFGTVPLLTVLFVPVCVQTGFSVPSTVILIAAAAALGDAGSPVSDTTLGPTAGLNADGLHNHIKDTCIPTFIHYNTALIVFAVIAAVIFG